MSFETRSHHGTILVILTLKGHFQHGTPNHYSYASTIFLSKNSPERILIINSWNSENILSFIFFKSSGKRKNGSGQDLSNSTSIYSAHLRSLNFAHHSGKWIDVDTLDYLHDIDIL